MLYEPSEASAAFCAKLETSAKRETRRGEKKIIFFFSPRLALRALCKMPHLPSLAHKTLLIQARDEASVEYTRS